ncbi:DUF485 domain-containing protein [Streptomyces sp. NPDC059690]|uniref:DUF485 domain-containing protein n=1 Tax=Streptomyces sp. NPDC059690 TaxID=3346907 RepID=UPI003686E001
MTPAAPPPEWDAWDAGRGQSRGEWAVGTSRDPGAWPGSHESPQASEQQGVSHPRGRTKGAPRPFPRLDPRTPPQHGWGYGSVWAAQNEHTPRDIDARTAALQQLQADHALLRLRAARRRPTFTMVGAIFSLYVLEILLANEAVGFMAVPLAGPLNVGLALSLLQCVTSACAVRWYARHARRVLDPEAARVRALRDWEQA